MRLWICLTVCFLLTGVGCQQEAGIVDSLEKTGATVARGLDGSTKSVRFGDGEIAAECVEQLKQLSTLQEVHGKAGSLNDEQAAAIIGLPKLTAVTLLDSGAGAAVITGIKESMTLRDVDLSGASGCNDEVIAALADQMHLRVLKLDRTPLTDASAKVLGSLSSLEELSLLDTEFTAEGIAVLAEALPNLKSLSVRSAAIDDSVMAVVAQMKNLESLNLSGCRLTGSSLAQLTELASVRQLLLADCPDLTNEGVLLLGAMPTLEELDVSGSQFSGVGFNQGGFRKLSTLLANRTKVTDECVGDFTGTPVLYSVQVRGTSVTEEGVRKHFAPTSQTNWAWDQ